MTLVLLQNAWSPVYAGRHWPRGSWLLALERSRSGQRLRRIFPDLSDPSIHLDNIASQVSKTPSEFMPVDHAHIRKLLRTVEPDVLVTCGKLAERVMASLWPKGKDWLAIPHPANRLLSNTLLDRAKVLLRSGLNGRRIALRTAKDGGYTQIEIGGGKS